MLALLIALSASAAGSPCDSPDGEVAPAAGAVVPRNAKIWITGRSDVAPTIGGVAVAVGGYDENTGVTRFTPQTLDTGPKHIYAMYRDEVITVEDRFDLTPPAAPRDVVPRVTIEPGTERVDRFVLQAVFDPETALVRITVEGGNHPAKTITTTPQHLDLCRTGFEAGAGDVAITVQALDVAGNASPPVTVHAVARIAMRAEHSDDGYRCGLGPMMIFWAKALLALIAAVIGLVVAVHRRVGASKRSTAVSSLVAEALVRRARTIDGVMVVVAIATLVAARTYYGGLGNMAAIWVVIRFRDYAVASRAIALIEQPLAAAELDHRNLIVSAAGKRAPVLLSRGLIRRAKLAAVPAATVR